MAAIDKIEPARLAAAGSSEAKALFHGVVWQWYNTHQNDVIKSFWVITLRVRDARFIFEALAGPE